MNGVSTNSCDAFLARRARLALALLQTAAFAWALTNPQLRPTTPDWMWACLIVLTFAGIVAGALLQRRRVQRPAYMGSSPLQRP